MMTKNTIKPIVNLFIAVLFSIFITACSQKNIEHTSIQILSINDFHGAVLSQTNKDVNPGAARFVTAVKIEQSRYPNTIIVSAGDSYTGSAISNLLHGKPVSDMYKLLSVKVSAVGNHEFDWGIDKIPVWEKDSGAVFLAANIYDLEQNKSADFAKPYQIIKIDGVNIAFLGLTTPETAYKTKPENIEKLIFNDPVETTKKFIPILKNQGADIIVLLTHIGSYMDTSNNITLEEGAEGLPYIPGVDAIITGHTHRKVNGYINNVAIVQGLFNGRAIGQLIIKIDKQSKSIISINPISKEIIKKNYNEDPQMALIIEKYTQEVHPILYKVIGKTQTELKHDKESLSILGEWAAGVMNKSAGTQIAFINGGGLRTSIPAGDITIGKMYEVMPFDNVLSIYELTGRQIKEVFEHGIYNKGVGTVQFSGVKLIFNTEAVPGKKVVSLKLENCVPDKSNDDCNIVDNKTYKVVTNDFMAAGGDGYTTFKRSKHIAETLPIRDILIKEVETEKVIDYKYKQLLTVFPVKKTIDNTTTTVIKKEKELIGAY